jgi:hypothetical protein
MEPELCFFGALFFWISPFLKCTLDVRGEMTKKRKSASDDYQFEVESIRDFRMYLGQRQYKYASSILNSISLK